MGTEKVPLVPRAWVFWWNHFGSTKHLVGQLTDPTRHYFLPKFLNAQLNYPVRLKAAAGFARDFSLPGSTGASAVGAQTLLRLSKVDDADAHSIAGCLSPILEEVTHDGYIPVDPKHI